MNSYNICFLATAINRAYEDFLLPFCLCALHHNPHGCVELVVEDVERFVNHYHSELYTLFAIHKRFIIRPFQNKFNHHVPNTYRFFETPVVYATYTYIMDVDVMMLDDIVPLFAARFPSKPHLLNNIIRKNTNRLTGMHYVHTKNYFTPKLKRAQKELYHSNVLENDEEVLYDIVQRVHPLPPREFQWRPIFGIHFSPNRGLNKSMQLRTTRNYYDKFMHVRDTYPTLFEFPIFKALVTQLQEDFVISE